MTPTIPDIMNALDEVEHFLRGVIDDFTPIWPEDEQRVRRAMRVLHEHVRTLNTADR